tara:strand:+ start:146 stop:1726 length:1581 start_codon:yes stop_codon:yes gene_type:complete
VSQIFYLKKYYFYFFLIAYCIIGIFLSLNVGITHDESYDYFVGEINKKNFLNTFFFQNYEVKALEGMSPYYGSGFHFFSAPFEYVNKFFFDLNYIVPEFKPLLLKHPSVFVLFIFSSIYFRKIIFLATKEKNYASICAILYLSYPYLLGHSFFNVKDMPFLSVWLICTSYMIKITKNYYVKNNIKNKDLIILSLLTAFLLSIRISGVLIFIEYFIFLIFAINLSKTEYFLFIKKFYKKISFFLFATFLSFYILSPSYWANPFDVINGIKFMSQHTQTVCTMTLGECMKAQNLPSTYLPIWLFFKLPILIIFGFILLILKEKLFFSSKNNQLIIAPIIVSFLSIILLLILFKVNLYDELRQVMFLVPLMFITALSAIFTLSKKISYSLIIIFIILFTFQNIKIYPYNYIWMNNFSNLIKVNNNFELDYWGVSTKKIAEFLNKQKLNFNNCVISNRNNGIKAFINDRDICFLNFSNLHKKNKRPFYIALTERSLNKGLPNNCNSIHNETVNINFSKEKLILAKVFKCD